MKLKAIWEAIERFMTGTTTSELNDWAERRREHLWRTDPDQAALYGIRKPRSMRGRP
jgi:hypothetical protein